MLQSSGLNTRQNQELRPGFTHNARSGAVQGSIGLNYAGTH
jgi:hypothetical protein